MRFIISSAVLALISATSLSKKSFMRDSEGLSLKSNTTISVEDDDTEGLSEMADKAMPLNVLSGLTQSKESVNSEPIKIPIVGSDMKFKDPYDHEAHKSEPVALDFNNIKIEKSVTQTGPLCKADQWAVVSWKAFSIETGAETKSSEQNPAYWKIGEYKVSKCWELAVSQMRANEKATIECPRDLIDQGLDKTDDVFNKDLGRRYEFEVMECDKYPAFFQPDQLSTDKCFYIKPSGVDGQGSNLALTVDV